MALRPEKSQRHLFLGGVKTFESPLLLSGLRRGFFILLHMSGWIKLHRSLLDWEWYDDANATRLLIHLLVSVNYERKQWHGITVEPGTIITSFEKLSKKTGLTVKQVRLSMKKLESSGETTSKRADKGQAITLVKWDKLQSDEEKRASKRAGRGQDEGRTRATTKEGKKGTIVPKEGKEVIIPDFEIFKSYAVEKKPKVCLEALKRKYDVWVESDWHDGNGQQILNWKTKLINTLPYLPDGKIVSKNPTASAI